MALTAVTTFNVLGGTQSIVFDNPSQIDSISFAGNAITWGVTAGYTLSKQDYALFQQYINVFNNLLFANFSSISSSLKLSWPFTGTDLKISQTLAPNAVVYTQKAATLNFLVITYVPGTTTATITPRATPTTITLQEWFSSVDVLTQFATQVAAN